MKLKTKVSFLILFVLLLSVSTYSQTTPAAPAEKESYKHAIGVAAGFTTAYGLSYRYIPKKLGIQVTFAPYKDKTTSRYSLGFSFIDYLIKFENINFYLYQGNHYYYEDSYYINEYYDNNTNLMKKDTVKNKSNYFNNGFGAGIEMIFYKRLSLNLMFGYGAYQNFKQLNMTGEVGLFFKL